ncbi:hypothetical protein [Bosea sp. (in: a-proteobacteria)]|jgi:hypothetical protein|uniref:hypothetical protein n=1 Tax=Bosea sp. (in: a-proteobacteria) TaxID=1871050 RepID=UPI003F6F7D32
MSALRSVTWRGAAAGLAFCAALAAGSAVAQIMPPVEDPVANSQALMKTLESDGAEPFTDEVMRLLKKKGEATELSNNLRPFSKKTPDVSGVAYDRNYNNLVRMILIYAQYDDNRFPFMYYQFTYKMTKAGWVLTNFRFENETSRAFPEGFTAP